jgi:hypothetical protein
MNYGPFAQKWGAIGTDGRLAVFPDRETGFKAMGGLLDTYRDKHGLESVSGIINRWAPRQYDNNSTDNYIRTVSQRLGIDPNMPVPPEKRTALMEAMATYEAGRPVTMGGPSAQPQPIAGGAAPMTPTTPITPYDGMMPADAQKHRKLAQLLAGQATDASPVGHWTQALARVIQGGVGRMHDNAATEGERQGQASIVQMMSGNPSPQAMMANPYTQDMGKQLFLAQAKQKMDPTAALQAEKLRFDLDEARAMNPLKRQELEARIKAAGQKDALDEYIMGIIGGGQKPQAAPSPIQPQSFVPDAGADPNLIRTQASQPQAAPQNDDPMVDTPAGRMPASRARQLGLALAMRGKGDAGRMIADPAVDQAKLAKEARNKVDTAELDLTEQVSRIKSIKRQFRPEFQTYEEAIKQAGIGFADKFDFMRSKLPPEMLQKHAEFISFRRDAIDNVNRYIKEITGAAMAIPEAERIMKGIPNESDGPTAFKAKIDAIERTSLMAIARTRYLRENGFKGQPWSGNADDAAKALSIEGFSRIIDQEGDAMSRQLRAQNPNAKPEQINGAVKSMLRQKFRLDI